MRSILAVSLLAACTQAQPDTDVVGPFTGSTTRFVVDAFTLPTNNSLARQLGDDLDGNGSVDNQLGMVIATLATFGDTTSGAPSMIGSGVLASSVEIQADDLQTDPTVAVRYFGADGAMATVVGGAIANGAFTSNPTRTTRISAQAEVHLAVFADADPTILNVRAVEITLAPDGHGGYDGLLRGVCDPTETLHVAAGSVLAMLTADPQDHLPFASEIDTDHDGLITIDEVEHSGLVDALISPDVEMFEGDALAPDPTFAHPDSLSLGFGFHLSPCPTGSCITAAPADRCSDRVLDGDETDIDCGGSCGTCGAGAVCALASDCESGACDGHCAAPTCSDGRLDGFESDLDCGSPCATKCAPGKRCMVDLDCASGSCGTDATCH